jgi:hypothetical protein
MKYFLSGSFLLLSIITFPLVVNAQDTRSGGNAAVNSANSGDFSVSQDVGLREIRVPIFSSFIDFNTENASVLTWITFLGGILTVGLVVFWIYLIVKAGVKGMQSQGNAEKLSEAFQQLQSVLVGAALTLVFPLFLSLIGLFLGIGTIFSWPKMFQFCTGSSANGTEYEFYFQALLDSNNKGANIDDICKSSN